MSKIRVGLVGASGETGTSFLSGLLEDGSFQVVALTRPASMTKPANIAMKARDVELRPLDLSGPQENLVAALQDIEILISAIGPLEQLEQIPLAPAAKEAGVRRFFPCAAVTVMPIGVHRLRDLKEEVYNHIKRIGLSYTIIDVGWWYQIAFPSLPSGKLDYVVGVTLPGKHIPADGNVPSAITDVRDMGRYVARIAKDERTVNKYVLVYNELWTQNAIYDKLEELSGEKIPRTYLSPESLQKDIADSQAKIAADPKLAWDFATMLGEVGNQYLLPWGVRGEKTPEYAKFLGYVTSKELYPDMEFIGSEEFLEEAIAGKANTVYAEPPSFAKGGK